MKNKVIFSCLTSLFFSSIYFSQDLNNKWIVGLGSGTVLYSQKDQSKIGFRYSQQFPRFTIGRYIFRNVSFVGHFSSSTNENNKYTTFDGDIRYDFGTSENTLSFYALIGGSLIDTKLLLPLVNVGGGSTLWLSERVGLNGQLMYKINNSGFNSQASHFFGSAGLVFRFDFGGGSGFSKSRGNRGSRRRLWQMRH